MVLWFVSKKLLFCCASKRVYCFRNIILFLTGSIFLGENEYFPLNILIEHNPTKYSIKRDNLIYTDTNKLPREGIESPFLEVFKVQMWHLGTQFSGELGSDVLTFGLNDLKASSNLNNSMTPGLQYISAVKNKWS